MLALSKHIVRPKIIVDNVRDKDPTQTIVLRQLFVAQINKRFRALKGAINEKLITEKYLEGEKIPLVTQAKRYKYRYADRKLNGFMEWLESEEAKGILEMVPGRQGTGFAIPVGELGQEIPWTDTYIQTAYQKGIANARADLRREGAEMPAFEALPGNEVNIAFNTPFHSGRVGLVYTRSFNGMKGITAQMNTQISHRLARGMAEGRGIREIAGQLKDIGINERVDKIGITRGRLIARTEVVYAHNSATLNEFERIEGFTGEKILCRWFTARDERVRAEHAARHNKVYTRDEAESLIGEPNCRCSLLPYIPSIHGKQEDAVKIPETPKTIEKPKFVGAKTIDELNEKTQKLNLGRINFDKKYSKKDTLNIGNQINEHMEDLFDRFPGLKKTLDKQGLFDIYIEKTRTLPSATGGASGRYVRGGFSIELAGSTRKTVSIPQFGQKNWTTGTDLFSILRHEFGHHIYYKIDKPMGRFWKDKGRDYAASQISQYSKKNAEEAFCEMLSGYTSPLYGKNAKATLTKELDEHMRKLLNALDS